MSVTLMAFDISGAEVRLEQPWKVEHVSDIGWEIAEVRLEQLWKVETC